MDAKSARLKVEKKKDEGKICSISFWNHVLGSNVNLSNVKVKIVSPPPPSPGLVTHILDGHIWTYLGSEGMMAIPPSGVSPLGGKETPAPPWCFPRKTVKTSCEENLDYGGWMPSLHRTFPPSEDTPFCGTTLCLSEKEICRGGSPCLQYGLW